MAVGAWGAIGFAGAIPTAWFLLLLFRRFGIRQRTYDDAPAAHRRKMGTPTMGGLTFIVVFLAAAVGVRLALIPELVFLIVVCGAIGAIDDALGIVHGVNRGLRARTKFLASALAAAIFLRAISGLPGRFPIDTLFHAGALWLTAPHWLWLLLGILAITGTIHAVNLTDGLDGLAAGTIVPPLIVLALIAVSLPMPAAAACAAIGVGACAGFLVFNLHPAKLFMGDTGSLALGALLSGVAVLTGEMLLLVIVGGVFVAEALSVMLQVAYFKATHGKRIFAMSPLHHHFEISGWSENRVTSRFWLASVLCSLLGWAIVR